MEIIQITKPTFEVDGETIPTNSQMYRDLSDFQRDIDRKERMGYTKCYFYSLYTQHEPNFIIYWVRCRFMK